ncbi:MAG: hypothetical protein GY926_09260 [bacterium]|nr:hypothetical protein [bacterium]
MRFAEAYWDEEDTTFCFEVDDAGTATRQVEVVEASQRYIAAASLTELAAAGSRGDRLAYRDEYGFTAETPLQDWEREAPLAWISMEHFESVWVAARSALGSRTDHTPAEYVVVIDWAPLPNSMDEYLAWLGGHGLAEGDVDPDRVLIDTGEGQTAIFAESESRQANWIAWLRLTRRARTRSRHNRPR